MFFVFHCIFFCIVFFVFYCIVFHFIVCIVLYVIYCISGSSSGDGACGGDGVIMVFMVLVVRGVVVVMKDDNVVK